MLERSSAAFGPDLTEAVPAQAVMTPVALVALIVGVVGFTVIVNVIGVPVQFIGPVINLLSALAGSWPTGIVVIRVLVVVL